jgi:hypothetical protein
VSTGHSQREPQERSPDGNTNKTPEISSSIRHTYQLRQWCIKPAKLLPRLYLYPLRYEFPRFPISFLLASVDLLSVSRSMAKQNLSSSPYSKSCDLHYSSIRLEHTSTANQYPQGASVCDLGYSPHHHSQHTSPTLSQRPQNSLNMTRRVSQLPQRAADYSKELHDVTGENTPKQLGDFDVRIPRQVTTVTILIRARVSSHSSVMIPIVKDMAISS